MRIIMPNIIIIIIIIQSGMLNVMSVLINGLLDGDICT
jgi:hypothetical protein